VFAPESKQAYTLSRRLKAGRWTETAPGCEPARSERRDPVDTREQGATEPPQTPRAVLAAQWLFFLIAAIWIGFALLTLLGSSMTTAVGALIVAVLMCGNAAILAWLGWGIGKQDRRFWRAALAVLTLNLVTDQVGFFDVATFVIDLGLLCLLIVTRSHYPRAGKG
jgi:hypothetical protein